MGPTFCQAPTRRGIPRSASARYSRRPQPTRAYLTSDIPPNVREAREWIAAWKARRPVDEKSRLLSATDAPVLLNARNSDDDVEAPRVSEAAIPEPAAQMLPVEPVNAVPHVSEDQVPTPIVEADGTVVFSKDVLDVFSYEDMLAKLNRQAQ